VEIAVSNVITDSNQHR